MTLISSIKDPLIVHARKLNKPKGRLQNFLIEGAEPIGWALDSDIEIQHVFVSKDYDFEDKRLFDHFSERHIKAYSCSDGIMKKINESKYLTPIIAVATIQKPKNFSSPPFVLLLDDLQDQGNIGTIVRTAAAFGLRDILTAGRSRDLFNKKTITASRGQVFNVDSTCHDDPLDAIKSLKEQGYQVIATSPHGARLQSITKLDNKPIALIVGNETSGSSKDVLEQADITVQIPMQSDVESLNVAVATGISLYELKLKVIIAMLTKHIRSTLGRELGVTHQLVQRVLDKELKNVTPYSGKQIILLMIMVCDVAMTREQIEKDTSSYGQELDKLLQPLLDNHLVTCKEAGYSVTPAGEELLGKIWIAVERSETQIFSGFDAADKKKIRDMLKQIQKNCDSLL